MTHADAHIIAHGLPHDGISADKLSPAAIREIKAAIDKLIEIADGEDR